MSWNGCAEESGFCDLDVRKVVLFFQKKWHEVYGRQSILVPDTKMRGRKDSDTGEVVFLGGSIEVRNFQLAGILRKIAFI